MEIIALKKKARTPEPEAEHKPEAHKAKAKTAAPAKQPKGKPDTKAKAPATTQPKAEPATVVDANGANDAAKPNAGTVPAKQPKTKPQFLALARVTGKLVSESPTKLFIETEDGARLAIGGFGPRQNTLLRLFAGNPKENAAIYTLWPGQKGQFTICGYHDGLDNFEPMEGTPHVDQMLISAKLAEISENSFSVSIGRNRKIPKGQLTKSNFKIDSPPTQGWQAGQWISIQCERHGEEWRMISDAYAV